MRPFIPVFLLVSIFTLACGARGEGKKPRSSDRARGGEARDDRGRNAPVEKNGLIRLEVGPDSAGEERSALVHIPEGYDASKKWPVIWAFHGGKNSAGRAMVPNWRSQFDGDYILVFPNGQRKDPSEGAWFVEDGADLRHVEVVRAIHEELGKRYNIDPDRQFVTGFSSGAHMTWQLACKAPDLFQAFAPVSHYLLASYADDCAPDVVRPLILTGSKDDPRAPYEGRTFQGEAHNLGATRSVTFWTELAGCPDTPAREQSLDRGEGTRLVYGPCAKAPVQHLQLEGLGHEWPRGEGKPDLNALLLDFWEGVL